MGTGDGGEVSRGGEKEGRQKGKLDPSGGLGSESISSEGMQMGVCKERDAKKKKNKRGGKRVGGKNLKVEEEGDGGDGRRGGIVRSHLWGPVRKGTGGQKKKVGKRGRGREGKDPVEGKRLRIKGER